MFRSNFPHIPFHILPSAFRRPQFRILPTAVCPQQLYRRATTASIINRFVTAGLIELITVGRRTDGLRTELPAILYASV